MSDEKGLTERLTDGLVLASIKADDVTVTASEGYGDDIALRLLVKSVPILGPSLDLIFSEPGAKSRRERASAFLRELAEDLSRIDEDKVDKDFMRSPEFEGVVDQIIRASSHTSSDTKRKLLREALTGSVIQPYAKDPMLATHLALVEVLSVEHISLLRLIRFESRQHNSISERFVPDYDLRDALFKSKTIVEDLISRGLLREKVNTDMDAGDLGRRSYKLSETGSRFLGWLGAASSESEG